LSSCGQQIAPSGGPKDSLPPKFIGSIPPSGTVNFKGNRLVLRFDEFITLDNPFEKLIYSPIPKKNPEATGRLKNVTIELKDSLQKNTTYFIDFGNSIKDINENNVLQKFSFVFSTGSYIDSGFLFGKILIAETGKPDSTLIAVLQTDLDDSAVAKTTPRYYTKLKGDGSFSFKYIKPGRYNLFALKDADGSKKYDQLNEMIGFIERPVIIGEDTSFTIYAFGDSLDSKPKTVAKTEKADTKKSEEETSIKSLKFSNNLQIDKQDLLSELKLISTKPIKNYDTGKIRLVNEKFEQLKDYTLEMDSTNKIFTFNVPWKENMIHKLIIEKDFAIDTAGLNYNKTDTLSFTTKKESEYGSLSLNTINFDSSLHPMIFIKSSADLILKKYLQAKKDKIKLLPPGEYFIEILFDTNMNGKWTTGDYWKKIQPERVVPRKEKIAIKPNFENEITIDIKEIQKTNN
jgi:uncharacterized protein (DUF2141 family)